MEAKNEDSKTKEKNYRSKYDANRHCYRQDETHYVYQEWVETGKNKGFYKNHVFTVGEEGVTLELLDYLLATDNGEVQDQENDERNAEKLAESLPAYAKSPEEELDDDEGEESSLLREFNTKVKLHLSEYQMNLIYERYGMDKSLQQIADESPLKEDGTHITRQAVSGKLNHIFAKVKKYMPQD